MCTCMAGKNKPKFFHNDQKEEIVTCGGVAIGKAIRQCMPVYASVSSGP